MRTLCYCIAVVGVAVLLSAGRAPAQPQGAPPEPPARPAALEQPGVSLGEGLLSKRVFVKDDQLGPVTDIKAGKLDPAPGVGIGIAGSAGALFVDGKGDPKARVTFRTKAARVDILDLGAGGACEFMNRGSWRSDASLMRHDGRVTWTYGGPQGVNDMAAGDVNGDGKPEFAVGFNGKGGIHLLRADGEMIWKQADGNVWHVEMVDVNGDGHLEILHSNFEGRLLARDAEGKVTMQCQPDVYVNRFSLCSWPAQRKGQLILAAGQRTLSLLTLGGATVSTLEAPDAEHVISAEATPITVQPNDPPYLAVVVTLLPSWERSVLYLYEPTGGLVYREVLEGSAQAISAQRLADDQTETLLVGGEGQVWAYKPLATPQAH